MHKLTCAALLLLIPSVAAAQKNQQPPPPSSTITLSIPGLNCNTPAGGSTFRVSSWSLGASNGDSVLNPTTTNKANLQDLSVSKAFDGCSAALLTAVTTGAVVKGVVLTQVGADVSKVTIVRLDVVKLSSWVLSSRTTEEVPSEQVSLNFARICIEDQASGTNACYDASTATQ